MEGTEPYTGYEDYDPGMSDSALPQEAYGPGGVSKPSSGKTDAPPAPTAYMHDTRRQLELDLSGDAFTLPEKYASRYTSYGEVPLVPVYNDRRRAAIHPLVIVSPPAGVEETRWKLLDRDGIFSPSYNPRDVDAVVDISEGEPSESPTEAVVSAGSGGDGGGTVSGNKEDYDPTEMPFLDHLEEFRWSLLKSIFAVSAGMIISWFLTDYFFTTFTALAKKAELPLVTTKLLEVLFMKLQMALVMGIILAMPFVFYFVWSFVSPGLYKREKKWILPLVYASTGCFFLGASIAYFLIIPMVLMFLRQFIPTDIIPFMTIGDFVGTIIKFIMLFGVVFQMPLISYVLAKIGIIKHTLMVQYRKYAIVVIFIIGAILTPPDPFTQILMAGPLILLYEVSIFVAKIAGRKTLI